MELIYQLMILKKKQVDFKMEYLPEKLLIKVKENYLRKYNLKQILKNGG